MRIYRRGKTWYVDYAYKGRRVRKAVGSSRKIAELTLKDIELKIEKGENLGIHDLPRVLFKNYTEEYLEYSKANKAYWTYYTDSSITKRLVAAFGDQYLFDVTSRQIEEYKAYRLQSCGLKPDSVNRELCLISHMFNKAVEWGYVRSSPFKGVNYFKKPPGRMRFLRPGEVEVLLEACSPRLRPIVVVALNTGLRKSEILDLRWGDVDLVHRAISVKKTKNNEPRVIPVNQPLLEEFVRLPRGRSDELVFGSKDGKKYTNVRGQFVQACTNAGIEDFTFHDLRHTFASHLVISGVNLRTVMELMGHKDIKMTMRYSHLSRQHLEEAVGLLGLSLTGEMQRQVGSAQQHIISQNSTAVKQGRFQVVS